ncbi:inositol monophosphatase/fructose-1,6-bisphosphatase family protein [Aciduliprofundum sp. MAR08-339]|uniref:inositol monophosphatase family protein n=1 Tax=Aciduliprofundum sp. (strain MAR08-339) TaxID=673860 RepID=UPI0002A4BE20|nr:inositol monophosphatase/fructose-1,6-bisphosphatase family protein [Aciduliprofundum sp. MAR08-339]
MSEDMKSIKRLASVAAKRVVEVLEEYGPNAADIVKTGAYGLPSSRVDVEAESAIINMVEEEDMPYNIFTEEAGFIDRNYKSTIIVDPLDGSYNAEAGLPYYSVSIAVAQRGIEDVRAGIVKNVVTGDEYYAIKDGGAFKNLDKIHVDGGKNLFVIYLGNRANPKSFEIAKKVRRVRSLGSAALEMCLVAEGIADAFIYNFKSAGVLRIVDIAAAYLIVKEAGGLVLDANGMKLLRMNIGVEDRRNVIALAKPEIMGVF